MYRAVLLASLVACSVPDYFLVDSQGSGSGSGSGQVDAGADAKADAAAGAATISNVSSTTSDGFYKAAATISIQVTFTAAVTVDETGGTPTLALNTGSRAAYASGSGTTTLTFTYTVAAGEQSSDLDYTSASALALNGGTIKNGSVSSSVDLPAPGTAGSLGANKAIVIDAVAPIVGAITGPSLYAASTSATLSYTITEANVGTTTCTQTMGTGAVGSCTATGVTFTGLSQGSHTVSITHTDAAGNVSAAQTYSWTVDTVLPIVSTVTGPAQYVSSTSASLSYSVSEANPGTTSCTQNLGSGTLSGCTSTGVMFSNLSEGFHSVSITHTDLAGNVSAVRTFTWTVDTTAPTLSQISGPPTYASSTSAQIFCTASDTNPGNSTCTLTGTGTVDTCDQFGATLSGLGEGPHTFTFQHTDRAGNTSTIRTFSWTVDTIPPVVSAITGPPPGGWISTTDVTLNYTVTETNPNTTTCSHTAGTGTQSACTSTRNQYTALSPGLHTMTINHTDLAGNVSIAQTITFSSCAPVTFATANSSRYQFVTPSDCGTQMDIWAWGGGGSGGNPNTFGGTGGGGGFAAGTLTVASGTTYSVYVGGGGKYATGGLNGGGNGGVGNNERGGGGGGWSGVSLDDGTLNKFYLVAAGGGGGGGCVSDANGGGAGGPLGFDGTGQSSMGGKGATSNSGGAGGASGGQAGVNLAGGAGAGPGQLCGAGGGGGGMFGGGGGGSLGPPPAYGTGGGGGGSSFLDTINLKNPQGQAASGSAPGGRTVAQYVQGVGVGTASGNFNNGGDGMVILHVHP